MKVTRNMPTAVMIALAGAFNASCSISFNAAQRGTYTRSHPTIEASGPGVADSYHLIEWDPSGQWRLHCFEGTKQLQTQRKASERFAYRGPTPMSMSIAIGLDSAATAVSAGLLISNIVQDGDNDAKVLLSAIAAPFIASLAVGIYKRIGAKAPILVGRSVGDPSFRYHRVRLADRPCQSDHAVPEVYLDQIDGLDDDAWVRDQQAIETRQLSAFALPIQSINGALQLDTPAVLRRLVISDQARIWVRDPAGALRQVEVDLCAVLAANSAMPEARLLSSAPHRCNQSTPLPGN